MSKKRRTRRTSGSVRRLPSGKVQARILDEETGKHVSIGTFPSIGAADAALARAETAQQRGEWVDPRQGQTLLCDFATEWLRTRPRLRPRTKELYESQIRLHIVPTLGNKQLTKLTPAVIRSWYSELAVKNGISPVTVSKVYRLLRTILSTAVEDKRIVSNPCVIQHGGKEESPERPLPSVEEALALADEMPPHLRPVVLVAAFTALRLGEILGLKRRHVDFTSSQIAVRGQLEEVGGVPQYSEFPKTNAGYRTVVAPSHVMDVIRQLLEASPVEGMDSWIFRHKGLADNDPVTRMQLRYWWKKARKVLDLEHLHFHDLRHTGQSLAVGVPGVGHADVMKRMGHSTIDASERYMHARGNADAAIAEAIQAQIERAVSGTQATVTELPEAGQR